MAKPTVYTNARLKVYPHTLVKQVATGAIFPLVSGEPKPRPYAVSPPGQAKDQERSMESSRRGPERGSEIWPSVTLLIIFSPGLSPRSY